MARTPSDFPFSRFLGFDMGRAAEGEAVTSIEVKAEHLNPNGVVHGAVLFALVDTAMGAATMTVVPEGQRCASIEVQLRFSRPVFAGNLVGRATVVHPGKRVVQLRAEVHDETGQLVAWATGSFAVIPNP